MGQQFLDLNEKERKPMRAAIYVRMSTEHQQYSTENQRDTLFEYASAHNMEVVQTYADEGKSGLKLQGRDALRQMIEDVEKGNADFKIILVYDVSRWGRFQDADESAYYEYICKRAGIRVEYCAEQFENDDKPTSTIVKSVKRAMAGEYSRELSAKVFQGQCRLIQMGFRQGGTAGYGLRRMLINEKGEHKGELKRGEMKSLQTDRVILVPGPREEVETVRKIYRIFVKDGKNELEIASILNQKSIKNHFDSYWTRGTIHQVLTNEKYIGNNVYNRLSFKLKKKRILNPPDMWIRADGVFEPIVDPDMFYTAKGIILARSRRYSNDEMISLLKTLYEKHGRISGLLIDETDGMPSSAAYQNRFGGLIRAYRKIGYTPEIDYQYIEINRHLRRLHPQVVDGVINEIRKLGGTVYIDEPTDMLIVNGEFSVSLVLVRCKRTPAGSLRWHIRLDQGLTPDITVAARMNPENDAPQDYYLLPSIDLNSEEFLMAEDNGAQLDTYRFESLEFLFAMAERVKIEEVV